MKMPFTTRFEAEVLHSLSLSFFTILCSTCLLFSCQKEQQTEKVKDTPPNVIIILTDDQGYQDLGGFGSPLIKTPNIDQMMAEGLKLTDFYSAQAVCSASRAGLLTGCYPNRLGISGALMPNAKVGLNPNETTIAELLKPMGYATAIFGKWHLGDAQEFLPTKQGFDEFFGIPYSNDMWPYHPEQGSVFNFGPLPLYYQNEILDTLKDQTMLTTQITQHSIDFIKRNKEQPFFLYVAHPMPHVPLFVSDKFKGKSERGLYGDVIMEIDWSVGEILNTLKENNLEDNTLVIFTSDNGPWLAYGDHSGSALPLREGKGTTWEGGQRVPTVVNFPGQIKPGSVSNIPMMNIDLLPTIAHITGAKLPDLPIDGKNVWEIWTGKSEESPQEAYFFYYEKNELQAVLYNNWKLYFPHTYRTLDGPGGKDGFPGKYKHPKMEQIELYDLTNDISETNNVADQNPDIVKTIEDIADKKRAELGDDLTKQKGTETRDIGRIGTEQQAEN